MKIQEINEISKLFDFYGKLLNEKQHEVVSQYVFNNLSLAEISEIMGITRQAVKDLLDRTINLLKSYEQKLKVLEKFNKTSNLVLNNLNQSQTECFYKIWEE